MDTQKHILESSDTTLPLNGSEVSNKTLIVSSTNGQFVLQVFIKNLNDTSVEGFMGFPLELMPRVESNIPVYQYIVSTFCDTGGFCQFAVAALLDNTHVSLTFPSTVSPVTFCIGTSTFSATGETSITLMEFQALQIESARDLTGTHIYSYKPISVFAGTRRSAQTPSISPLVEQLVPSTHWGREVAKEEVSETEILKIVSNYPNTAVRINSLPEFVISNMHTTVVRKFETESPKMLIVANQTIQVLYTVVLV